MRRLRILLAGAAAVVLYACSNAGESRVLGIPGTGVLRGFVYLDQNGNLAPDAGDDSLGTVRVRLVTPAAGDTVATATSAASGLYTFSAVPVGTYRIVVDTTTIGDTVTVAKIDSATVTILPNDSSFVNITISYPRLTMAQARAAAPGRRVFVVGTALNASVTFSDTSVHVQDNTAAMRVKRLRVSFVGAGDSVRLRGTTQLLNNQPILDDVTVFPLGFGFLPAAPQLTTLQAAGADGATRDAQLVQILNATISDTATVNNDLRLTMDDGSGAVVVLLDRVADPAFRPPTNVAYIPGDTYNLVGLLVATGTPGVWRVKPRSAQDLVLQ